MKHQPYRKVAPLPSRPRPGVPAKPALPSTPHPTHWGNVADWYDQLVGEQGSDYHQNVVIPGVLRLLQLDKQKTKLSDLKILDLACGQGVLCRTLAEQNIQVTGIDAAAPLIDAAQRRNESDQLPIIYGVGDATKLAEVGVLKGRQETFDAITLVLSIQNITPLSPVWEGCRALLKPAGALIVVMMHPCFRVPKASDWHWDDKSQKQSRTIAQYLSSSKIDIQTHPGLAAHGKSESTTTHFHRPLQAYINTMGGHGLLVDHMEEWASHKKSQPGPRQAELDRSRKEIPMFLGLRARKV